MDVSGRQLEDGENPKSTPASQLLSLKDCEGPERKKAWSHQRAVAKRIARYLFDTADRGIIFKPTVKNGIVCFNNDESTGNPDTI